MCVIFRQSFFQYQSLQNFGLGLFGICAFIGYLIPKSSFQNNSSGATLLIAVWVSVIHYFHNGIILKINAIERLMFEIAYFVSQSSILATTPEGYLCSRTNIYIKLLTEVLFFSIKVDIDKTFRLF